MPEQNLKLDDRRILMVPPRWSLACFHVQEKQGRGIEVFCHKNQQRWEKNKNSSGSLIKYFIYNSGIFIAI